MLREQIEARGVRDPAVLAAIAKTPRHLFVPDEYREAAYNDHPLPIGKGQTISQPYIVAAMTELLQVSKDHKVLEIGAGSGYQAAILGQLAREVYSIEIIEELARSATAVLKQLGYNNIHVIHGDGYKGLPAQAPFDRILVTAAPPEIPAALIEQLKPGGRLVVPVGTGDQELLLIEKRRDGSIQKRSVMGVRFVPMVKGTTNTKD